MRWVSDEAKSSQLRYFGETLDQSTKCLSYRLDQVHSGGEFRRFTSFGSKAAGFGAKPSRRRRRRRRRRWRRKILLPNRLRTVHGLTSSPVKIPPSDVSHPNYTHLLRGEMYSMDDESVL